MTSPHIAHRWASSVALQALGPVCAFATVFVIARLGGAAAQGQFAQTKAWVDLLVVLGCFGFPQSIVYVVNRLGASVHRLARAAVAYSVAFAPLAWAVTLVGESRGWTGPATGTGEAGVLVPAVFPAFVPAIFSALVPALIPALAGVFLVLHGLLRGVYLTQRQDASFAVFSILPAVTLLLAVAVMKGQGPYGPLILVAAAVPALVGAAMTLLQLRRVKTAPSAATTPPTAMPWRALFSNGTQVFAQAVLMALQPLLAYGLVRAMGGGDVGVGRLNSGVFLAQGLIVPIGLVSPLMFARWTSSHDAGLLRRLDRNAARWVGWGVLGGLAMAVASWWIVPLVFGVSYRAAAAAVAVMMLTVPQAAYSRLVAPALHAHGQPGINTIGAAVRLAGIAVVACLLGQTSVGPLVAVAVGWSSGEVSALAWTLWALHRLVIASSASDVSGDRA